MGADRRWRPHSSRGPPTRGGFREKIRPSLGALGVAIGGSPYRSPILVGCNEPSRLAALHPYESPPVGIVKCLQGSANLGPTNSTLNL